MTMIEIDHVSKRYGDSLVVNDLSLCVARGEIAVIVGTSGSGKSTLLKMINRLVEMSEGRIRVNDQDITSVPPTELRRRIGYAIQGHGLFPHRTVGENIATVPRLLGWDSARIDARVAELLRLFELDPALFADKFPDELSGGEQQRVGVARALAAEPELLLMDEPFGALDPVIRAKAQEDLLAIQRRFGTTILLVTHDMDEAFRLGDRIAVMNGGRLLQFDRPEALLRAPAHPFVAELTGSTGRALKLMSLTRLETIMDHETDGLALALPASFSLRDALAEMIWRKAPAAAVTDAKGERIGSVTLDRLIAAGAA